MVCVWRKSFELRWVAFMLTGMGIVAFGQDIHFTGIHTYREWQNPSFVGLLASDWRAGIVYRNQWGSVLSPYLTTEVYFHMVGLEKQLKPGWAGAGFLFSWDEATPHLRRYYFQGSIAYFHSPWYGGFVGAGLGVARSIRVLNMNGLLFESQLTSEGFDASLPTGEPIMGQASQGMWTVQAGVTTGFRIDVHLLLFALGMHHIVGAQEYFLAPRKRKIRYTFLTAANVYSSDQLWVFKPMLYVQMEGLTWEPILAALVLRDFHTKKNKKVVVSGGLLYRIHRNLSPLIQVEYSIFKVYALYDYQFAKVGRDITRWGGPELGMEIAFPPPELRTPARSVYCPRL